MSKFRKTEQASDKKKMPYNVLRKGVAAGLLGVSLLAGGFLLTGCGGQGPAGNDGATWYSGTQPQTSQGKVGDFFYDTDDCDIYLKMSGGWTLISNIKGVPGDDGLSGALWHTGTAVAGTGASISAPVAGAKVGDLYFNTATCDIYTCVGVNTWKWVANTKGSQGEPGKNGSAWITGTAITGKGSEITIAVGGAAVGDVYLNTDTCDMYLCTALNTWKWIANTKGTEGPAGAAGTDGSKWYSGTELTAAEGKIGDFFLDTDDFNIYLKVEGGWTLVSNIKGAAGEDGKNGGLWLVGTSLTGTGDSISQVIDGSKVGDLYLNAQTCDIYTCIAENTWKWVANTKGAAGTPGQDGKDGSLWLTGTAVTGEGSAIVVEGTGAKIGDFYFNTATCDIYTCTAENTFKWISNTKGDKGDPGQGSKWFSGTDVAAIEGNVGDFFFDTDDNCIYLKSDAGWNQIASIQGEKGEAGENGTAWFTGTIVSGTADEIAGEVYGAKVGDIYFNTETNDVYTCISTNTWKWIANTHGADGISWHNGTAIERRGDEELIKEIPGTKVGDLYLNTATCDIFECIAENTWKWIATTKGTNSIEWIRGTTAPEREVGKDGDFYFNVSNLSIYEKQNGYWVFITTIKTDTENVPKQDWDEDGALKVLAIGNSYSDDTFEYAFEIALGAGIENVEMAKLTMPSSSLETHVNKATSGEASYKYSVKKSSTHSGEYSQKDGFLDRYEWTTNDSYDTSIESVVTANDWDYIVFQQVSSESGNADSYGHSVVDGESTVYIDHVQRFIDAVEPMAPRAKFAWNMTWAYPPKNDTLTDNYSGNQMNMYNAIVNAVTTKVADHEDISVIIPTGTAIQNARSSILKDKDFEADTGDLVWTRDYGYGHLTNGRDADATAGAGAYTAGLTLIEALTGISMYVNNDYVPTNTVTDMEARIAADAAGSAILKPYEVTTSYYNEEKAGYEQIDPRILSLGYYNTSDDPLNSDYGIPTYYAGSIPGVTSNAARAKTYLLTDKFTKEDLPNGTLLVATAGYRAEGWVFENGEPLVNTSSQRGGSYGSGTITIDDSWWLQPSGNGAVFTERAFNLGPGNVVITADNVLTYARSLKIYVPVTNA